MRREGSIRGADLSIGPTSTDTITPDEVFDSVLNLTRSDDGGYRSVPRVVPFLPASDGAAPNNGTPDPNTPTYGRCYGVFHARVEEGQRDITLLHTDTQIWEFTGWSRSWRVLVGPAGTSPLLEADLPTPLSSDFPTQFVSTPTGIIIIPQGGRAYFYDGVVILPLGYQDVPPPPLAMGPRSSSDRFFPVPNEPFFGVNDSGYVLDGLPGHPPSTMSPVFRKGRIGTVSTPGNISTLADSADSPAQVMGYLEPYRTRGVVQWIDRWGNLSAPSPESNEITFGRQPAMRMHSAAPYVVDWCQADLVQKQIAWDAVAPGPEGTIGRIIGRNKDLVNSGDPEMYQIPRNSTDTPNNYATLTDNLTRMYPDNIPDAWLFAPIVQVMPFPQVKLACMAFGRAFFANAKYKPGALYWSEIGRYGTVLKTSELYPSPTGSEITGLFSTGAGLLALTEEGAYLVTPTAEGFTSAPVQGTPAPCSAPSSVRQIGNGGVVWLGPDGFYGFDGSETGYLWRGLERLSKRHDRAWLRRAVATVTGRGEYRCWVAVTGSTAARNSRCYTYSGSEWHHRNEVYADGVCTTQDHRRLVVVAGRDPVTDKDGVWVQDAAGAPRSSTLKTGWLGSTRSNDRRGVYVLRLQLRETGTPASNGERITIQARKDYRAEVVETVYVDRNYPALSTKITKSAANPALWGTALWDASSSKWRRRRPFWITVNVDLPACEAVQFELTCSRRWEILAVSIDESPVESSGAMSPRGGSL